jgi:glutathione synthase/RimK-type ligase-like ATP-grasp enzyme
MTHRHKETIAFATSAEEAELTHDDRLVIEPLRERGIEIAPLIWDRGGEHHRDIVVRSCWDYHRKAHGFAAWIDRCQQDGTRVWNPPHVLRWNLNKKYLLDLANQGVAIPATVWLAQGADATVQRLRGQIESDALVLKPAVSLGGNDTYLVDAHSERANLILRELLQRGDVIAQAFVEQVQTEGEVSLVFLGDRFSHAIRKTPRQGEFRIHVEHGGSRQIHVPSDALVAQAERVVHSVGEPLLYARVDGVVIDNAIVLMELELIDPMLFLAYCDEAPQRFADAIVQHLARRVG